MAPSLASNFGHYPRLDPPGTALSAQLLGEDQGLPLASLQCNLYAGYLL
ncbi:hypothetical protein [Pseudomonas sp. NBRC 100443]|nr:hypothetical protein [Pseudomonas sp. NBRC 100443]GLU37306.1 hypothetical protein Pssp01_13990 [Pseudomonas sp. NBRC 100443]